MQFILLRVEWRPSSINSRFVALTIATREHTYGRFTVSVLLSSAPHTSWTNVRVHAFSHSPIRADAPCVCDIRHMQIRCRSFRPSVLKISVNLQHKRSVRDRHEFWKKGTLTNFWCIFFPSRSRCRRNQRVISVLHQFYLSLALYVERPDIPVISHAHQR